jgi:hypothetical protein
MCNKLKGSNNVTKQLTFDTDITLNSSGTLSQLKYLFMFISSVIKRENKNLPW